MDIILQESQTLRIRVLKGKVVKKKLDLNYYLWSYDTNSFKYLASIVLGKLKLKYSLHLSSFNSG